MHINRAKIAVRENPWAQCWRSQYHIITIAVRSHPLNSLKLIAVNQLQVFDTLAWIQDTKNWNANRQNIARDDEHKQGYQHRIAPGRENAMEPIILQGADSKIYDGDDQGNREAALEISRCIEQQRVDGKPYQHEAITVTLEVAERAPDGGNRHQQEQSIADHKQYRRRR